MTHRLLRCAATLSAAALTLAACGSSNSSSQTQPAAQQHGGNLIFARAGDILTLDPIAMTDNESIWTAENIYQTLFTSSANGKQLEPLLATGYTLSPNHLVWTIHLRKGVRFQNGKPMTSADVKFSIRRASAPDSNAYDFNTAISSITNPNPYTIVIRTKYPWAPELSDLALYSDSIIPANYGGESKSQFFSHPVGTGPFRLSHWAKGSQVVLVRNPYYWQPGKPYLNEVTFNAVPDDTTRGLQLRGGQADVEEAPPFSSISALQSTSGVSVDLFPSSRTDFLLINENHAPFDNVYVRRAISYAINRKALVDAVLFGHGQPANSILSPGLWAYDPHSPGIQYNLAEAKRELAQSPVPHGFSTTIMVGSGATNEESLGQIIQAELKPLGIKATIREVDASSEYTDQENGQYDLAFDYDTTDIIDPSELISFSAMGGNTGSKTHAYFTNYNNPTVDSWATQAQETFSHAARQDLYNKIQVQVAHDAPMAFLYYSPFVYATSSKVKGFTVSPTGEYDLADVSLAR